MTDRPTRFQGTINRLSERIHSLRGVGEADWSLASLDSALEELRVTEEALALAREEAERERIRYYDLFEFAPDPYLVTDPFGSVREANHAAKRSMGVKNGYLVGKPLTLFVHAQDRKLLSQLLRRMRDEGRTDATLRIAPRQGDEWVALASMDAVRQDGYLVAIRWMLRNITEQQRAHEELLASRKRISDMASRLALVEEQERRRIANDIHDHISQSLAVAKLRLGMLRSAVPPAEQQNVDELRQVISQVIAQTRTLIFELSPSVLYELGLAAALEWLIEQRAGCGIRFELESQLGDVRVRRDVAITLFRAVRELMANLIKHSGARVARIGLARDDLNVRVEVSDDGVGFDVNQVLARKPQEQGLGLPSMRERLDHLGGSVQIDSAPGRGARFVLSVPIDRASRRGKSRRSHATERHDR